MQFKKALGTLGQYVRTNSDGGSRAELIDEIVATGLERPTANAFLDALLQGLVDMDWLEGADYDLHFAPRVSAASTSKVLRSINAVFDQLDKRGGGVHTVRRQRELTLTESKIALATTRAANLDTARQWIQANAPDGPVKKVALHAVNVAAHKHQQHLEVYIERKAELEADIARAGA